MGSFNTTCGLTRSIIKSGTEVVMLLLTRRSTYNATPIHTWDLYAPIPILFEGRYGSYGTLENTSLFQSMPVLAQDELREVEKSLLAHLREETADREKAIIGDKAETLDDLFKTSGLGLVKDERFLSLAKTLLVLKEQLVNEPEKFKIFSESLLTMLGFKTVDEAESYIEEHKEDRVTIPVAFMMCRKDAFMTLMNEFGVGDTNKDHYAPVVQAMRAGISQGLNDKTVEQMMDFLTVDGSFAGSNAPAYSYLDAIDDLKKAAPNVAKNMTALSHLQGADLTLLNQYFDCLGITYQPTMYVNEDLKHYGHIEAFSMQQRLLEQTSPGAAPTFSK